MTGLIQDIYGIYGVVAYSVGQRTHEFGIRLALGAARQQVLVLVLKQALTTVTVGAALGLAAARLLTRMLCSLLFGINPADPLTFSVVAGLLFAVALAASYIPARSAAKVDPMVALRYE